MAGAGAGAGGGAGGGGGRCHLLWKDIVKDVFTSFGFTGGTPMQTSNGQHRLSSRLHKSHWLLAPCFIRVPASAW